MNGIVMDIQRFCLQDGPGIRTTVFLQGCNMRCKWCHNPESMEPSPVLMYREDKCIGCGICVKNCPQGVHSIEEEIHRIDRKKCAMCKACIEKCPADALFASAYETGAEKVFEEICKDEKYYLHSGGGVTFSGGEATLQFDFLKELLLRCRGKNYHTAIETNGIIPENRLQELLDLVDLFLLDYKVTGSDHKAFTAVEGDGVIKTLDMIQNGKGKVILRCPVIPGINDTEMHFKAIRDLKKKYSCIQKVEIMSYHDTGKGKWKECGKQYELAHIKTASTDQKSMWEEAVREENIYVADRNE